MVVDSFSNQTDQLTDKSTSVLDCFLNETSLHSFTHTSRLLISRPIDFLMIKSKNDPHIFDSSFDSFDCYTFRYSFCVM